eukprot:1152273-Pelagomonas_calceolata.AAC.3
MDRLIRGQRHIRSSRAYCRMCNALKSSTKAGMSDALVHSLARRVYLLHHKWRSSRHAGSHNVLGNQMSAQHLHPLGAAVAEPACPQDAAAGPQQLGGAAGGSFVADTAREAIAQSQQADRLAVWLSSMLALDVHSGGP